MAEDEYASNQPYEAGNPTELLGVVFDIKEFALFDGPGLRCTVFMKGCPLRCTWCHNPEGLKKIPEKMNTSSGARHIGFAYTVDGLVKKILSYAPVFTGTEGGVTFSGGEPLFQPRFVMDVMRRLKERVHIVLQTCGFAEQAVFVEAIRLADIIYFDFKLADPAMHRRFTMQDNASILTNLMALDRSGVAYRLRMPLVPGVTDTEANYDGIRTFIKANLRSPAFSGIDLLPYNRAAGGKYEAVGRAFTPGFDETSEVHIRRDYFDDIIKEVHVL